MSAISTPQLRTTTSASGPAELGIHAVYPQRAHVPPKVRAFVDFLADRFRRKPSWGRA